ncbi:MAG: hypothetical protein WCP24_01665, partial [bacterium]
IITVNSLITYFKRVKSSAFKSDRLSVPSELEFGGKEKYLSDILRYKMTTIEITIKIMIAKKYLLIR